MPDRRKDISLDNRLLQCASFVRDKAKVVDVGTDHGYLAIYLVKTEKAIHAIASDLREGPLNNALENIKRYGCENLIEPRLSDGLKNISAQEADDIVIAGMGGEVIANIIKSTSWLKDETKHLILQPMTMAEHLRRFLFDEGFEIIKEQATISGGKVYTIMIAAFSQGTIKVSDLYPYIGKLETNLDDAGVKYAQREIRDLRNKIWGCKCEGKVGRVKELSEVKSQIENLLNGE